MTQILINEEKIKSEINKLEKIKSNAYTNGKLQILKEILKFRYS